MPRLNVQNLTVEEKNNLLSLDNYIRKHQYRHEMIVGAFTGGANFSQQQASLEASSILFLDSGTQRVFYSFPRPYHWTNGYLSVTLYMVYTATDTNRKYFEVDVFGHSVGSSYAAGTQLINEDITHTSPTANIIVEHSFEDATNLVTEDYDIISLKLVHDGSHVSDTSTANMRLVCGYFTFHPRVQ